MKKLNQKGFTHHLLIFGLLALVVGAAGFAGYRVWKNKSIDAQAYNWTNYPMSPTGYSAKICTSPIGNSKWIVRWYMINNTNSPITNSPSINLPYKGKYQLIPSVTTNARSQSKPYSQTFTTVNNVAPKLLGAHEIANCNGGTLKYL